MFGLLMLVQLLAWIAGAVAFGWGFRLTRLPAVLAFGIWLLVSHYAMPFAMRAIIDSNLLSGLHVGTFVAIVSALNSIINTLLFLWLFVSLVQRAAPGAPLPWRSTGVPRRTVTEPPHVTPRVDSAPPEWA